MSCSCSDSLTLLAVEAEMGEDIALRHPHHCDLSKLSACCNFFPPPSINRGWLLLPYLLFTTPPRAPH